MIEKSEFVLFLLATGVLIFIFGNEPRLKKIPHSKTLIISFSIFFSGWVFTVLEGFFWNTFLNLVEHICYLVGAVFLASWCWKTLYKSPNSFYSQTSLEKPENRSEEKEN